MYKFRLVMLFICMTVFLCAGCGQQKKITQIEADTLLIHREGNMEYYLTEEFDKAYYDIEELKNMAQDEVSEYNRTKAEGTGVVLDKAELTTDMKKAVVGYLFPSKVEFCEFTKGFVEYDTLSNALMTGYLIEGIRLQGKNGEVITDQSFFLDKSQNHVIISDPGKIIYTPLKVQYYSEGTVLREDGGIDATGIDDENKKVIIILKK